jgi:TATA-box binding protein (TBP) (component of TFIID and TFIIIB)
MAVVHEARTTCFIIMEKGVVNINGSLRSAQDAYKAVRQIIRLLRKIYPDVGLSSWSVTNVYANARLPLAVRLDRFASLANDMKLASPPLEDDHPLKQIVPGLVIDFNPEVFAGLKIWFQPRKESWTKRGRHKGRYATLFVNGHMNLTGNKRVEDAWLSYLTIVRILVHAPYLWRPTTLEKRTLGKRLK